MPLRRFEYPPARYRRKSEGLQRASASLWRTVVLLMPFRILRLKRAVEREHRCKAEHVGTRVIVEPVPGASVWRGLVEVFDLTEQPQANRCYAWIEQRDVRSVCVTRLKIHPIGSAQAAVRRSIACRILASKKLPAY